MEQRHKLLLWGSAYLYANEKSNNRSDNSSLTYIGSNLARVFLYHVFNGPPDCNNEEFE